MDVIAYNGYVPGLMSRIIEMQATFYHRFYNFGLSYEISLANDMANFLERYDSSRDILLYAYSEKEVIGSITIKGSGEAPGTAQLVWYIMDEDFIGYGVGTKLIDRALSFCREQKLSKVYLWTFKGLNLAESLYLRNGFHLIQERENYTWGSLLIEQRYEKHLSSDGGHNTSSQLGLDETGD